MTRRTLLDVDVLRGLEEAERLAGMQSTLPPTSVLGKLDKILTQQSDILLRIHRLQGAVGALQAILSEKGR